MIEIVRDADASTTQLDFVKHWSEFYFRPADSTEDLEEAPVHWRVFLSSKGTLVAHVAVTNFQVELDDYPQTLGAIGGLFTVKEHMGRGFGNALMTAAEELVFDNLQLQSGILFCLPALLPFYARRGWNRILTSVTLAQSAGENAEWPHEVMVLPRKESEWSATTIHVPSKKRASDGMSN